MKFVLIDEASRKSKDSSSARRDWHALHRAVRNSKVDTGLPNHPGIVLLHGHGVLSKLGVGSRAASDHHATSASKVRNSLKLARSFSEPISAFGKMLLRGYVSDHRLASRSARRLP